MSYFVRQLGRQEALGNIISNANALRSVPGMSSLYEAADAGLPGGSAAAQAYSLALTTTMDLAGILVAGEVLPVVMMGAAYVGAGLTVGLQALATTGQVGALLANAASLALVAPSALASAIASAAAIGAAVAGPFVIVSGVAMLVLSAWMTGEQAEADKKEFRARFLREYAVQTLNSHVAPNPTGPEGTFRPIDMFVTLASQMQTGLGRQTLTSVPPGPDAIVQRPSIYNAFLEVEGSAKVPEKERALLRSLRWLLQDDLLRDGGTLAWPLYIDLLAKQFKLGRFRYPTSNELAWQSAGGKNFPDVWVVNDDVQYANGQRSSNPGHHVVDHANKGNSWAYMFAAAHKARDTDTYNIETDYRLVYGLSVADNADALLALEQAFPGIFNKAHPTYQEELQAVVNAWLAASKGALLTPAQIAAARKALKDKLGTPEVVAEVKAKANSIYKKRAVAAADNSIPWGWLLLGAAAATAVVGGAYVAKHRPGARARLGAKLKRIGSKFRRRRHA